MSNTTTFKGNMDLYNQVKEVPKSAIREIKAGRLKGKSDINAQWRIEKLTEMFGICGFGWKIKTVRKWIEEGGNGEKSAFVDIELFVKIDGEWSEPIEGNGGSSFVAKEKNGMYTSDECFKMAKTDAISVACKSLGIAGDVYRGMYDDSKYTNSDKKGTTRTEDKIERSDKEEKEKLYFKACILELVENNEEKAKEKLEELTSFEGRDGKQVKGISDIERLNPRRLKVTFDKFKKVYPEICKLVLDRAREEKKSGTPSS